MSSSVPDALPLILESDNYPRPSHEAGAVGAALEVLESASARDYEELQRPRAPERRAHRIKDLPAPIAAAIQGAKMDASHNDLDGLLDENRAIASSST